MSNEKPKASFITFYSFKGGVGRSMALINTAGILAGRGFRVLVIDLDLEAPGLSYLNPDAPDAATPTKTHKHPVQHGFVDLLSDAKKRGEQADLFALSVSELAKRYARSYKLPKDLREFPGGSLHIMPAGKFDSGYAQRFDALNLRELYQQGLGEPLVRALKKKIAEAGVFDYVLVDSRTGFSDEAGICTRDLPDLLMILSGLNRQNVQGTSQFLKALRVATNGKAKFQMILSPVPNGEDALLDEREDAAKKSFEEAWGSEIDLSLQIPYHPQLALTEEPHIFRRRRGYLFDAYRKIERSMLRSIGHDAGTLVKRIEETIDKKDFVAVLGDLRRLVRLDRGKSYLARLAAHLGASTRRYPRGKAAGVTDQDRSTLEQILSDKDGRHMVEFIIDQLPLEERDWGSTALLTWLTQNSVRLAERLHKRLIAAAPQDADTLSNYAVFLKDQLRNRERAELYYTRSVEADPTNVRHLGNYALFLEQSGDMERAEIYYKRAIEADSTNAWMLGYYADFLEKRRGDKDGAEALYKRALVADPKNAWNLNGYAGFLEIQRGDKDGAEALYKRAIDAGPKDAWSLSRYAAFLELQRGDKDGAEALYKRALVADPKNAWNLSRYAAFLDFQRGDRDGAEALFKRAIDVEPKDVWSLNGYATFLENRRADNDSAESFYKRGIEADPKNAWNLCSYAVFLEERRGDKDGAEAFYKRAIEADPQDTRSLRSYADFLAEKRSDMDGAEAFYKRAIEADAQDAGNLRRYADFLTEKRGNMVGAEVLYKRAIEAEPKDPYNLGASAVFLERRRGDMDGAEALFKRALDADPKHSYSLANYGQFLVADGRLADGEKTLLSALKNLEPSEMETTGEVCFSLWLVSRMQGQDALNWERAFKFVIRHGFEREPWNFDRMLAQAQKTLQSGEFEYAKALAAAFLDESKVPLLDQFERWRALEPLNPAAIAKDAVS